MACTRLGHTFGGGLVRQQYRLWRARLLGVRGHYPSLAAVARRADIPLPAVYRLLARAEVEGKGFKFTVDRAAMKDARLQGLAKLWKREWTINQIAQKLGLSKQGANNAVCKARHQNPGLFPYRRGDKTTIKPL